MNLAPRPLLKRLLPLAVLIAGGLAAAGLMATRGTAARNSTEGKVSTVEVVRVNEGSPRAQITATGLVEGDRSVQLSSRVSGEVVRVSAALRPGGRFRRGQMILKVDPRDYAIAVSLEQANLLQAQLDLELEQQRGHTAAAEWEQLGASEAAEKPELTLRKPQLAAATARLAAAEQGLARAELNLERTTLRAPFASMVLSEAAEKGQLLVPGSSVLSLVGTARFVVRVSIQLADLKHIVLGSDKKPGSPVLVTQRLSSGDIERTGWVKQLARQIDPQSGTATVFVAIDDPLEGEGLPLLPGAFVEVVIEGRAVPGAVKVPRSQVQEGGILWTVEDGKLKSREVKVGWADAEHAFITEGLSAGAAIVVTPLSLPVDGAPVSVQDAVREEG